jgi:chromosome segregation ATPase
MSTTMPNSTKKPVPKPSVKKVTIPVLFTEPVPSVGLDGTIYNINVYKFSSKEMFNNYLTYLKKTIDNLNAQVNVLMAPINDIEKQLQKITDLRDEINGLGYDLTNNPDITETRKDSILEQMAVLKQEYNKVKQNKPLLEEQLEVLNNSYGLFVLLSKEDRVATELNHVSSVPEYRKFLQPVVKTKQPL